MSSVLPDLSTPTFQDLMDDARASIPPLAPAWTDYNVSDPGIMLLELLAWNTEAQIYALGHVRRDERTAYSALVGVRAQGPLPASGLIWPQLTAGNPPPWAEGMLLQAQTPVHAQRGDLPDLFLSRPIWLYGGSITGVVVLKRDGTRLDNTPINLRRGGSFPVLGPSPAKGDRLLLRLSSYPVPLNSPTGPQLIAVGFHIRNPVTGLATRTVATARFRATLTLDRTDIELPIRDDSTLGLAQTGVMLIECPAQALASGAASTLSLEMLGGEMYPTPLAERIDLNVLEVVQQKQRQESFTMRASWPDTTFPLDLQGAFVCFGDGEPPVRVSISTGGAPSVSWTLVDELTDAEPNDTVFTFDPLAAVFQFGNGVNGAIPASGSLITADYRTSQGSAANVAGGLDWVAAGMAYGTNLDAVAGGVDGEQLSDLQARSRQSLTQQPIVTDADLLAAAAALTGLRVVRAEIAPIGSSGPGVRMLVVIRDRGSNSSSGDSSCTEIAIPETTLWLEAVRRSLSARLTLGQRLHVIAPRYVPVSIQVEVTVSRAVDPPTIADQIMLALQSRFAVFASTSSTTPWPMGSAVAVQSIRGWVRAVPGVMSVTGVQLTSGNNTLTSGSLSLPPTGLPQLTIAASDITVTRVATGSRR